MILSMRTLAMASNEIISPVTEEASPMPTESSLQALHSSTDLDQLSNCDLDNFKDYFFHPDYTEEDSCFSHPDLTTLQNRPILSLSASTQDYLIQAAESIAISNEASLIQEVYQEPRHKMEFDELLHQFVNRRKHGNSFFKYSKWQDEYSENDLFRIYYALLLSWGDKISTRMLKACNESLDRLLRRKVEVRLALMEGDELVFKYVARHTSPEECKKRLKSDVRDSQAAEVDGLVAPIWSAVKLSRDKIAEIEARLSTIWGFSDVKVRAYLRIYAERHGRITSPEPLLSTDCCAATLAADLIARAVTSRRQWTDIPLICNDVLHQESLQYERDPMPRESVYIGYLGGRPRSDARRYTSEAWQQGLSVQQIGAIHAAVASQWVNGMDRQTLYRRIHEVNLYLGKHTDYIKQIAEGDDDAAYQVAQSCIMRKEWLTRYRREVGLPLIP